MSIDLLSSLNEPQRQAVSMPLANAVVLAGAGSGKTRVLINRIGWLITQENLSPHAILAVTFTNKAAGEMKHRLAQLLGYATNDLWVGTFHGIAHRFLRLHYAAARLPQQFQILDSDDQLRIIKRVMKDMNLDPDKWPAKKAQWYINAKKDEGLRPSQVDDHGDPYVMTMLSVYKNYEAACQSASAIDFAEILLRAHEVLLNSPDILVHYQRRFSAILVDEFQDTNTIQYAWIRLLAGLNTPVMIVGDDDQSIYGWRGARIENIHRFSKDFANTTTIRLEQNYRSTQNILSAANSVIQNNADRMGKSLWTQGQVGAKVALYNAYNENDEARFVTDRIKSLIKDGREASEIAILYRSNAQSRVMEESLLTSGVAYRIYGGLRYFERAEIKDVLSYLRLINFEGDDTAFERVVNVPVRGIGLKTIDAIRQRAREEGGSLWKASLSLIATKSLTARAANALQTFLDVIQQLKDVTASAALDEKVNQTLTLSGLWQLHSENKTEKSQSRLDNMKELVSAAKQFLLDAELTEGVSPLQAFLSHASLEAGEGQANENESCVQLMTMHSAKGLEFPAVFIIGMEEGLFPSKLSLEEHGRLEEERRLCYVAMTRARELLTLSHAEVRRLYGREEYHRPSRFIQEIPKEYIEEVRLRSAAPIKKQSTYQTTISTGAKKSKVIGVRESNGYHLGQMVDHKKFGPGVILNFEGEGDRARVQVQFKKAGSKWLVMKMANLETV